MDTVHFLTVELWLEEEFWALEGSLVHLDDLTVWKSVFLDKVSTTLGLLECTIIVHSDEAELFLDVTNDFHFSRSGEVVTFFL